MSSDDLLGLSNLNEDVFPCIPNSSLDSRSNESTVRRWDACGDDEILNDIQKFFSDWILIEHTNPFLNYSNKFQE